MKNKTDDTLLIKHLIKPNFKLNVRDEIDNSLNYLRTRYMEGKLNFNEIETEFKTLKSKIINL